MVSNKPLEPAITAVILAGGKGERMGGLDKGLIDLGGKLIIEYILEAIAPQCDSIIINANRNIAQYQQYNHPVLSDEAKDFQGPLAGFSTGLNAATQPFIITLPCDAPSIPNDFVQRMYQALMEGNADIAVAHDGENLQPMYTLIKSSLSGNLQNFMLTGERKTRRWFDINQTVIVDFSDNPSTFHNINTDEQYGLMIQTISK